MVGGVPVAPARPRGRPRRDAPGSRRGDGHHPRIGPVLLRHPATGSSTRPCAGWPRVRSTRYETACPPRPTPHRTPHRPPGALPGPAAVDDDRDSCIARYELFLGVARRPHLCPALDGWGDAQRRTFAVEPAVAGADNPEGNAAQCTC
ncbi:hypothetical protein ACFXJ6_04855 [Streptomyces sp. NPDC059218]|uniref:hypothetical protein n=1 Tax=unclassified Streptomyces TaxID=2593676 RepID=UPI0036A38268